MKLLSGFADDWTEAQDDLPRTRIKSVLTAGSSGRVDRITAISFKERVLDWEPRASEPSRPAEAQEDLHAQLVAALRQLPVPTRRELLSILHGLTIKTSSDLWGAEPELSDIVAATIWHEVESAKRTEQALSRSLSVSEAAARGGLPEDDVSRLVELGAISAVHTEAGIRIPMWQFDDAGKLIAGLEELIRVFPGSAASLAAWVEREHPDLGESPRMALLHGGTDAVVFAASRGSGIA